MFYVVLDFLGRGAGAVAGGKRSRCGERSATSEEVRIYYRKFAVPKFERIMIDAALRKTGGRKKDAAELLGWGRNTLTRKIQELHGASVNP